MKTKETAALEYAMNTDKANAEWVAEDFIAGVTFAQQWTSVEDELPEEAITVLVRFKRNDYDITEVAHYFKKEWHSNIMIGKESVMKFKNVTHWRPI